MVEHRNLVTGQNPASAAVLGNPMLEILKWRRRRDPARFVLARNRSEVQDYVLGGLGAADEDVAISRWFEWIR